MGTLGNIIPEIQSSRKVKKPIWLQRYSDYIAKTQFLWINLFDVPTTLIKFNTQSEHSVCVLILNSKPNHNLLHTRLHTQLYTNLHRYHYYYLTSSSMKLGPVLLRLYGVQLFSTDKILLNYPFCSDDFRNFQSLPLEYPK